MELLSREHIRTCLSVLNTLHDECVHSSTSRVYKSLVTKLPPTSHIPILQPRNSKQVENVRLRKSREQWISQDTLHNLHELAIDMPSFIHLIKTHPDLVCVCGEAAMLEELDHVLLLDSPSHQLLSYYTTFQLGNYPFKCGPSGVVVTFHRLVPLRRVGPEFDSLVVDFFRVFFQEVNMPWRLSLREQLATLTRGTILTKLTVIVPLQILV